MKFIGYHIDDDGIGCPIATGQTKDEAMEKTIKRILGIGVTWGEIAVREKPELSDEDFATVTLITDEWAKSHGVDFAPVGRSS